MSKSTLTTSGDEDNLEENADIKPIIKGGKVVTTLTDSFSHTSLIGKPRHFKLGDNFYQFCERFIEYVNINGITWHLDLIFLSLLDDRTTSDMGAVVLLRNTSNNRASNHGRLHHDVGSASQVPRS